MGALQARVACWENTASLICHLWAETPQAGCPGAKTSNWQLSPPPCQPMCILYSILSTSFFNHSHLLPVECTPKRTQTPSHRLNTSATKNTCVFKVSNSQPHFTGTVGPEGTPFQVYFFLKLKVKCKASHRTDAFCVALSFIQSGNALGVLSAFLVDT